MRYICTSNCSLRSAENIFLGRAFKSIINSIEFPKRDPIKQEMINLSHQIFQKTINNLNDQFISILLDSCKRISHNFHGIIIFAAKRLYFYQITEIINSKALTLNELVLSIIEKLYLNNTQVISICTDNRYTNWASFNEFYFIGRHILREPKVFSTSSNS